MTFAFQSPIDAAASASTVGGTLLPLLVGLVSALLGVLGGWLGAYARIKGENLATKEDFKETLSRVRENADALEEVKQSWQDRLRRSEGTAAYVERQIEEFYGPLFNLVNQVIVANHVKHEILETGAGRLTPAEQQSVEDFFQERHFFPVHREINGILKNKLYLIEGAELPDVYYDYLRSAIQEQAQAALWSERGVGTSFVPGVPYPDGLYDSIKRDLDLLMDRYASLTQDRSIRRQQGQ